MSQDNLKNKIIWFGDLVTPSGFGRIGNEVTTRLVQHSWQVFGLSMMWGGYPLNTLNYPVVPAPGPDWDKIISIIGEMKPDVVVCCQDFPYSQQLFHASRLDWSTMKFMIVTPIDGTPIHPQWLNMVELADSTSVISEFGVEGLRLQGKRAALLPPGVNVSEFYPAKDGEVEALRAKAGINPESFILGMFAMNQGRKCVGQTIKVFSEFCLDKPDAVLYLDMDANSPAGWDLPSLCSVIDPTGNVLRLGQNVLFKQDALAQGIDGLRERYLLCDINSVVSHREGFGLPLIESQACKVASMAMDYCSGPEVVGNGRGYLIRRMDYMQYGTWGNARDAFPDMGNWLKQLNLAYQNPQDRHQRAERGYSYAINRTWDKAASAFEDELRRVLADKGERPNEPAKPYYIPAPGSTDDGANRGSHHSGLQPSTGSPPGSRQHEVNNEPGDDDGGGERRLQPGIQPAYHPVAAGDRGQP